MFVIVNEVQKNFGKTCALNKISFQVDEQEIFGFIGPDGAGKTTLFRLLVTLLLPDSGTMTIGGLDVVKSYKQIRKEIGYMPGRFSLYQDLSVEENLHFFATIFGTTIHENYDLIKDIYQQIEPFKKRLAGKLSGGMKQKLALSCALIHAPKILILDEPTTGVDAVSRKEFWEMLKILRNKGITIIVSTPYMDEAAVCDRVALIQEGSLLQVNTPNNIIDHFTNELWAISADNMYSLKNDLLAYPLCQSAYIFGQHLHYISKKEPVIKDEITNYLIQKGHTSLYVEKVSPGIEDCFIALMQNKY